MVCEVLHWKFLIGQPPQLGGPVEVDISQFKSLRKINVYKVGNSWHIQNIQINKVIGENENYVLNGKKKLYRIFG